MSPVPLVALVSGGKDSFYAIHQATNALGKDKYRLVALAHVAPADARDREGDADSYMYQSVGHHVVPSYARLLGTPMLFVRSSMAKPSYGGLSYVRTAGDEVDDMRRVLLAARRRLGAAAACCGAILSDYQRVRFECACHHAGLTPLAPLWQRAQRPLLRSMVADGLDAAVVKVAALGLDPQRHLGKTLAQLAPLLARLEREFGVHSCGEGGEFESLVLGFPKLFAGRIDVAEARRVPPDAEGDGTVGHWVVERFEVVSDTEAPSVTEVLPSEDCDDDGSVGIAAAAASAGSGGADGACVSVSRSKRAVWVTATALAEDNDDERAVRLALAACDAEARKQGVAAGLGDAHYITFVIPRMAHFARVNEHYARHMPPCDPPARCCIEMAGGKTCTVEAQFPAPLSKLAQMLAAKAGTARPARDVMHVQSISPWAPSCIGPYAQMNRALGLRHYAGVIALDPWRMELVRSPCGDGNSDAQAAMEAKRAIASLYALYRRHGRDVPRDTFTAVAYTAGEDDAGAPARVAQALRLVEDGLIHGTVDATYAEDLRAHAGLTRPEDSDDDGDDDDDDGNDDRPYTAPLRSSHPRPLVLVADVGALPRGARFELVVGALDETWEEDGEDTALPTAGTAAPDGASWRDADSRRRHRVSVEEGTCAHAHVRSRNGSGAAAYAAHAWCTPSEVADLGWASASALCRDRAMRAAAAFGVPPDSLVHFRAYVVGGASAALAVRAALGGCPVIACRSLAASGPASRPGLASLGLAVALAAYV